MISNALVTYLDGNTKLEGFVSNPQGNKLPLVLLCHAWSGRDAFICEKARLVAKLGYVGFAIDMYGEFGGSKEENAALKKPFVDDRQYLKKRLLSGYEVACKQPNVDSNRVIAIGYGFGGLCALDLARSGVDLLGAVSVYGHFDPLKNAKPIQAKLLLIHGSEDPVVPLNELISFQQELDAAKVDWQSHVYGNTGHAFPYPPNIGAERSWAAIEHFLSEVFKTSD